MQCPCVPPSASLNVPSPQGQRGRGPLVAEKTIAECLVHCCEAGGGLWITPHAKVNSLLLLFVLFLYVGFGFFVFSFFSK